MRLIGPKLTMMFSRAIFSQFCMKAVDTPRLGKTILRKIPRYFGVARHFRQDDALISGTRLSPSPPPSKASYCVTINQHIPAQYGFWRRRALYRQHGRMKNKFIDFGVLRGSDLAQRFDLHRALICCFFRLAFKSFSPAIGAPSRITYG